MTPIPAPSAPNVGRFTGLVLGLIVFACVTMIGFAGYVKYELDRAQIVLALPESELDADSSQESFDKLRRSLGYGGFTGMAQNYATTHDITLVPDMKAALKQANDIVTHLPDKTPVESRHDIQSIFAAFDQAMQKIDKAADDPSTALTPNDMAPLYAALPIMDARIATAAAAVRMAAQNQVQFWAMLLTLISWCSLIIAAALAAGIYLTLRDRNSAPLRALSQSVKNMARGDMRTPIWGMERQDTLGELARAVDMARFQFSQLPDMALLSEQGPVRIRFEGNTRSLFEAMMRVISRDSEQVHQQTAALTEAIDKQQKALASLTFKVENVLQNVQAYAVNGDQQVRQALEAMVSSAEGLKNAQEHAADQLNRIIPYMQERAHGLSEITQITGKQVGQVLQTLMQTERNLKANTEGSDQAIKKLSASADELGERLFGAVNLLQASGKVLAETTEITRSRLEEAIERLNLKNLSAACFTSADMVPVEGGVPSPDFLRGELGNLGAAMSHVLAKLDELAARMNQPAAPSASSEEASLRQATFAANLMMEIKTGFEVQAQNLERMREQLRALAISAPADPSNLSAQMRDQWGQMAGQIEATRAALEHAFTQQIADLEARLADAGAPEGAAPAALLDVQQRALREAQQQMEQQTQILSELVATLGALDAHMQEIRSQVSGIRQKAS
jgi:methyl-accepting chemotaxis protein